MAMIYTSIEYENDCVEIQVVKNCQFKIFGVVDHWGKTMFILDISDTKNFNNFV